jgi:hypothetical protein
MGPDPAALGRAQELPERYELLQNPIGTALFEHYEPYREALEAGAINHPPVKITSASEVWDHVMPVHVVVEPHRRHLRIEIGFSTEWDIEHTVAAVLVDWRLIELNGSVLPRA